MTIHQFVLEDFEGGMSSTRLFGGFEQVEVVLNDDPSIGLGVGRGRQGGTSSTGILDALNKLKCY